MAQRIRETTDHFVQEVRQVSERCLEATRRVTERAGSHAARYRQRAQHHLDLATVRRKMNARYTELGRVVFLARQGGEQYPLASGPAAQLLADLDALKLREETLGLELANSPAAKGAGPDETTEEDLHL